MDSILSNCQSELLYCYNGYLKHPFVTRTGCWLIWNDGTREWSGQWSWLLLYVNNLGKHAEGSNGMSFKNPEIL